jgi:tetratricopeptide (TPR) repeat protein
MRSSQIRRIIPLYFILFCLLMALVFSSGCGTKNPALTSAKIYMDLTPPDYNSAMQQLLIAVQKDSLSGEAHLLLGRIYGEKKMYQQMQAELEKAERCKLKPLQADELKQLKAQLWTEVFNSGIHLGREGRQVEGYRLDLLADFTKYPQYKDSLKIVSTKVEGTEKLTWDAYGNYGEAKPALEQLQRILNQTAVERYQLALRIDSSRYEPYVNLAADCVYKEELEKALGYYQKAYQLKPDDSNVMNDYAITLLSAKKYDEALALYERILQKDPANVNALVNLAMIYAQKGETDKSLDTYSKIISIDPEYMDAYFNRGLLYLSQAQGKMPALKAYIDSVKNNRKNKELESRYQTVWGEYDRLFLKAEGDFKKAGEINPGDKEAFFHLGLLYVGRAQIQTEEKKQSGDFVQAEEFFKKSMELDQEDTESMRYLGFTYLRLKRWQDATSPLEKLIELDPTDREAWGYLAIAYANLGKKKQAEEALKKSAR